MALLHIAEPGQSTAPHEHRLAVGIDLGTTNSLVATLRSGVADTLPDEHGRHLLPSVVRYRKDAAPEVGGAALDAAVDDPRAALPAEGHAAPARVPVPRRDGGSQRRLRA